MTAFALLALALAPQSSPVSYTGLTNNYRQVPNFNVETVRGMALAPDGTLFVLNTHASQIVRHSNTTAAPEQIIQTILNPVSIALWSTSPDEEAPPNRILVVGGGTHALAIHDLTTGDILDAIQLRSEPADIVVSEHTTKAYVACQGDNSVLQIDLSVSPLTPTQLTRIPIDAERPRFLYLEYDGEQASDQVWVTSFLSGNGTAPVQPVSAVGAAIFDSYLPFSPCVLPDEDVFLIDGSSATAAVAKKRVGTLVTALARHPDGRFWVLNIDSKNVIANEPTLRGDFVDNRVFVGALDGLLPQPGDLNTQLALGADEAFAFPFGLAFDSVDSKGSKDEVDTARGFVALPLSDRVAICDSNGSVTDSLVLPSGWIPMNVLAGPTNLYVYGWGVNKVRVYPRVGLTGSTPFTVDLDIGFDPTPPPIQRGRATWYDGDNSAGGRSSCNSCHPGGKADFLGWQLSDHATDFKDVMVTQSLLGIEDTFPYHWRGERALIDFNGAFADLLGGSRLDTVNSTEFEDFQAFVFSLQNHANPRQVLSRMLEPTPTDPVMVNGSPQNGNPVLGQTAFDTIVGLNEQTCAGCHVSKSGSNGDFISETPSFIPSVNVLEVPHLRELRHKDQPVFPCGPFSPARSGFGVAHAGIEAGILQFLDGRQGEFRLNDPNVAHVTAFVRRFDAGIAPAAHHAVMYDSAHTANLATISALCVQAATPNRWIDLVAFGMYRDPVTNVLRQGRFKFFNPGWTPALTPEFECSNQVARIPLTHFDPTTSPGTRMVFFGVPPSSGRRFALDRDDDDLLDFSESVLGTDEWDVDTDNDNDRDGHEAANPGGNPTNPLVQSADTTSATVNGHVDFKTASLAKFEITADEPVRVDWAFNDPNGDPITGRTMVFARSHTIVVQGLMPSTPAAAPTGAISSVHTGSFTMTDLAGNTTTPTGINLTSEPMLHPTSPAGGASAVNSPLILEKLLVTPTLSGSGPYTVTLNVSANIRQRFDPSGPISSSAVNRRAVLFQIVTQDLVNPTLFNASTTVVPTSPAIKFSPMKVHPTNGSPVVTLPTLGDFVRGPITSATGAVSFQVAQGGLVSGQKVRLRLAAIGTEVTANEFSEASVQQFFFPPTKGEDRVYEYEVP